jgi:hypothetical protein
VCGFGLPVELLNDGKVAGVLLTSRQDRVSKMLMVNGVAITEAAVATVCSTLKLAQANTHKRSDRN